MAAALDGYSPCPGGTGKKIRFCCQDLLPELQRMNRMMEGRQWHACLEHVERVQRNHPDRACLFAIKGVALARLERFEELRANAEAFVAHHPDNPLAWAEVALAAALLEGGRAAIAPSLKALAACRDDASLYRLQGHVLLIVKQLVSSGLHHAGRALLTAWGGDEAALAFDISERGPLWFIEPRGLASCPADFPWEAEFRQALEQARTLRWFEAERAFTELAGRANGVPAVWQNLTVLRGWVGDMAGSAEAARRWASLVESEDDAAELEAYAAYSTGEMLGDQVRVPRLEYPVTDLDGLRKALQRDAGVAPLDVVGRDVEEVPSAPEEWYRLAGPPVPPEGVPEWACLLILVHATGDQPARLRVRPSTPESAADAQRHLEAIAGGSLGPGRTLEAASEFSATIAYFENQSLIRLASPQAWESTFASRRQKFVQERWPKIPLGLLGGKTFAEAVGDGALRRRALAAVLLLEDAISQRGWMLGTERLRSLLGLPPREPIDPAVTPLESVPLARLHLVAAEKLSGPELLAGFKRAWRFSAGMALARFGPLVADNPTLPWSPTRVEAADMALRLEPNYARVLACCQRWRQEARDVRGACAKFDIHEARARLYRGEIRELQELLSHLASQHIDEAGVAEALDAFRITLDALFQQPSAAGREAQPSILAPDGGPPGKLWTPDSARTPGRKPTLWTPGSP